MRRCDAVCHGCSRTSSTLALGTHSHFHFKVLYVCCSNISRKPAGLYDALLSVCAREYDCRALARAQPSRTSRAPKWPSDSRGYNPVRMPLLLLSSELETFELSDAAVALSVTLSNWPCGLVKVLDGSCPPAPIPATRLQKIVEFLETIADLIKDAAPQSHVMLIQQGLHRRQASIIRSQIELQRIRGRDAAEMCKGSTRYVDGAWDVLSATDTTLNGKGGNSILDAAQLLPTCDGYTVLWECPFAEHIAKEMEIKVKQPRPSDWSEVKRSMPASSEDVDKLRHLLGAWDDLSEEEKAAAAAESPPHF